MNDKPVIVPMLLTVKEVSKLLRIHRPKVYELIRRGDITGFKLGADWRIKRDSVEFYVGDITNEILDSINTGPQGSNETEKDEE